MRRPICKEFAPAWIATLFPSPLGEGGIRAIPGGRVRGKRMWNEWFYVDLCGLVRTGQQQDMKYCVQNGFADFVFWDWSGHAILSFSFFTKTVCVLGPEG